MDGKQGEFYKTNRYNNLIKSKKEVKIMKNGKLMIGLIGCGGIANNKHMPALSKLDEKCEMTAFCDIIEKRAVKAKEKYGDADAVAEKTGRK